jgi:hypothetical protein
MKIYIDHFPSEDNFVKNLSKRIKAIKNDLSVHSFIEVRHENMEDSDKLTMDFLDNSEIIIPIITADYLSSNPFYIYEKLSAFSEQNNKYVLPIIYSPSEWSSMNWLVKSKVFPNDGTPISELDENNKETVLNEFIQTIKNIVTKDQAKPISKAYPEITLIPKKIVFISHDHDDADFAELLKLQLEKNGITGWIDSERLKIGQDWRAEIDDGIASSIAIIAIMTPDARKSEYVTYEWAFAWGKGKKIFPIMLKQTTLHPRLESLQYLDFTNRVTRPWDELISSISELIK